MQRGGRAPEKGSAASVAPPYGASPGPTFAGCVSFLLPCGSCSGACFWACPALSRADAQARDAQTRRQGVALRQPGEADSTFVRRVLPVSSWSYSGSDLQALAWRPSRYGRQLVFTHVVLQVNPSSSGWQTTDIVILDPFRPRTYAVQQFHTVNWGDLSGQGVSPFLADVNSDGHLDLVALLTYDQSVEGGHMSYYRVQVWRTAGLDKAGRPRYREDETPYPYLEYRQDETPRPYPQEFTPATVRRLLARHQRQLRQRRRPIAPLPASTAADTTKKAGAASPQEDGPGQ